MTRPWSDSSRARRVSWHIGTRWSGCQRWCQDNNLILSTTKTKELVIDFRKNKTDIQPLIISGACMERVPVFRFLGIVIGKRPYLEYQHQGAAEAGAAETVLSENPQEETSPPRFAPGLLSLLHRVCSHTDCVWYGSSTSSEKVIHKVVRAAEKTTDYPLPTQEQIYTSICRRKVMDISKDSSHPSHCLFQLLPSGRTYRAMKTRINRLKTVLIPKQS